MVIENDVNAAVFGYGRKMKLASIIVGIYFSKYFGPGAGIMINGKILKGAHGYAGEVALLSLGIDWLLINYKDPQEVGPTISRLISVFCCIVNLNHIVLYGDFFTDAVKEAIEQEIPTKAIRNISPSITYRNDLNSDVVAGLIVQAVTAYQSVTLGKKTKSTILRIENWMYGSNIR